VTGEEGRLGNAEAAAVERNSPDNTANTTIDTESFFNFIF
jgi:hypothetical protein